ncbi:hypothetical protein EDD17DRAFT_1512247 [Pisolithus thermaeus]|nr:hypothetical protein EDD17DRAFT_1512247 [Pisolithus thermaeus]
MPLASRVGPFHVRRRKIWQSGTPVRLGSCICQGWGIRAGKCHSFQSRFLYLTQWIEWTSMAAYTVDCTRRRFTMVTAVLHDVEKCKACWYSLWMYALQYCFLRSNTHLVILRACFQLPPMVNVDVTNAKDEADRNELVD